MSKKRIKSKAEQAVRLFHFWCGKLNLPSTIPAVRDNRMDAPFALDNWDNENVCLRYHSRRIGQRGECRNISDILHEIGHLKNCLPYNTEDERVECEYQAEIFSVRLMKKHYPQEYKELLDRFRVKQTIAQYKKKDHIYYKAFMRIRDYRDTVK